MSLGPYDTVLSPAMRDVISWWRDPDLMAWPQDFSHRDRLICAASLIIAEIERLDREENNVTT